mmetsp:Transcript_22068/g.89490  ORF Transcript_22068/g.89490 Transcript_22068/m.89490 type:complete len:460 (-) Transcript_22068:388-1767(-)|eukprot:CAMPEP_0113956334 /NCGR_PEP_ID=MMETSP0011_2-20120614/1993_1 /TAXON_ID=101924 /ORGANISM="Rhodosorus marinus" /LENGTH=459 /DNA_ID=CAMNT_0000966447 /DNA_START=70 /DNA_END=1449 /DNA_ORIENTATION=+ /assembly_acc=CAM_ASM_000156
MGLLLKKLWPVLVLLLVEPGLWVWGSSVSQAVIGAKADLKGSMKEKAEKATFAAPDWSVYHKTDDILDELKELDKTCNHMRLEPAAVSGVDDSEVPLVAILGYNIKNRLREMVSSAFQSKTRIVAVFGEHGRELITSEVALKVVQNICNGEGTDAETAREELKRSEVHLVPVLGASSRRLAEMGEYCERLNSNGVDLNRNWGFLWGKTDATTIAAEERPGTGPFSENESRAVKALVESIHPDAFVSVHSGDKAMLLPWDHRPELPDRDEYEKMSKIAGLVAQEHCESCQIGNVNKLFGYNAFGTAGDWAFGSAKVPYTFTWEIYGDFSSARDDCFRMFNPVDQDTYKEVLDNWSTSFFTLAAAIHSANGRLDAIPLPKQLVSDGQGRASTPTRRAGFASEWRRRGQGGIEPLLARSYGVLLLEFMIALMAVLAFTVVALYLRKAASKSTSRSMEPFKLA